VNKVENARVAVVGGGVVGCSVLYHLAKLGVKDAVLLERQELTSGSSWHAAGNLFSLTSPSNVQRLQKYTIELYSKLEAESGQPVGYHSTGGLVLASTPEEVETLKIAISQARRNGVEAEFISMEEARRHAPILNINGLSGVVFEPMKGHVDPASATQAYAAAARRLGATIRRHCPVTAMRFTASGEWELETPTGRIRAEYVVNAAGLWAREVAILAGIELPLLPVEHHYMVTETIPEIATMDHELPTIGDADAAFYSRQEGQGLLLGAYESTCHHWAVDGTPLDFGHELLPNDLARMERNLELAVERLPCLATAGVKRVVNGAMMFSPDLGPLIGPHPALQNYFCAAGVMTAFNQGGGVGLMVAEWITEGEPSLDMSCWDVARFYPWANKQFTRARTKYFYENRDARVYPHQEYEAGRPVRSFPTYEFHARSGAVFGQSNGWEYPLWYAADDADRFDRPSYRRTNWFDAVGEECRRVRETAGLFDVSTFAKYEVCGSGAEAWLKRLLAGRIPAKIGKSTICPMVSPKGRLIGDFTVSRLGLERFLMLGAGSMESIHMRYFGSHPATGVELINHTGEWTGAMIAGPSSRNVLARLTNVDISNAAFPLLSSKCLDVDGVPSVTALRVSFTGELGYELYCPREHGPRLLEVLSDAGAEYGMGPAGSRALMSLRLEKAFPSWGLELSSDYTPFEPGLGRFVDLDRKDFVGHAAVAEASETRPLEKLVAITVNADDVDCAGGEAVLRDGDYVGYVTSGGYGHTLNQSLGMAYLRADAAEDDAELEVEIIGKKYLAEAVRGVPFDPEGRRMRS
jgi:dimethylglycine dehydrogenase